MNIKKIQEKVLEKDECIRITCLILGVFCLSLNYNLFLAPNNLVVGGLTGLSLVMNQLFGWNTYVFLYGGTVVLLLLSYFLLGWKNTARSIVGSVLYPIAISLTVPVAQVLLRSIEMDNIVLLILLSSMLQGLGTGLVFKYGFNTGGADIIINILNKKLHISEGKSSLITQGVIILLGGVCFGLNHMIYAIIILAIYSAIVDKIIIGISDSKLFFIYTKKWEDVRKYILNELETGVTILKTEGGYSKTKNNILMCVVPNKDYYLFKEVVLEIDPHAFFVIHDCYEVHGGKKRRNLPFI